MIKIGKMKKTLLLLLFTMGSIASYAQQLERVNTQKPELLDAKNGFRNHNFGESLSSFEGLELFEDGGDVKMYGRESENRIVGDCELFSIHYFFYKGKFCSVELEAWDDKNPSNSKELLNELRKAYGIETARKGNNLTWFGDKVILGYKLKPSTSTTTCVVTFYSKIYQPKVDNPSGL